MTSEVTIKPTDVQVLMDLDVSVAPLTLEEFLTKEPNPGKDPQGEGFPFFKRIQDTPPGQAFFIEKLRKSPRRLFWRESGDPRKLVEGAEGHRQIVAMVIVKDRTKGVLKPTADDLTLLRKLNEGKGRTPRDVVMVIAGINPKADDLELLLMAEVRGRMKAFGDKEITPKDISNAASLVEFQDDPIEVVQRLRDRFHNVWEFAYVPSAKLNPAKAREEIRKFQNLTA